MWLENDFFYQKREIEKESTAGNYTTRTIQVANAQHNEVVKGIFKKGI